MMLGLLLSTALGLAQAPAPAQAPLQGQKAPAPQPLSYTSRRCTFKWDQLLPLDIGIDGIKINSIFFDQKEIKIVKTIRMGARAQVDVTNTSQRSLRPGFAVAVFDQEDRLLGVASGGPWIISLAAGQTSTYDLDFSNVVERLPKGAYFILSAELAD
nr:hypothetical protein [uncultured Holophaga sp.]